MPALQYNPTNNNSDYINPIPSTSGTQKNRKFHSHQSNKKMESDELLPKRKKVHIEGKNSFLTNKNPRKRKNAEEILNVNAKKEKLEHNPRKRKNTEEIFNVNAKRGKLEHNPRKRKMLKKFLM